MRPEQRRQIQDLYDAALAHVESERSAFLREACAGDDELQRGVETLLAQAASGEGFSDRAPVAIPVSDVGAAVLIGRRVGPYRVLGLLGAGGMGEVYRARDTKLGRDVAIKILASVFSADP